MGRVQNQVAVVTGAARGLGQAISYRLAGEGAKLVIGDIDKLGLEATATKIRNGGGEVITLVGDITEEETASKLIKSAITHFGQIDILVNNVGGSRNSKIWQMPVEDWDYTIRLNLRGTFLCTKAAVPHMIERKSGKIICLSSGAREGTPWTAYYEGGAAYSASKAGIHGFMRDLALELAEYSINVNCVAPGPIDTEIAGAKLRRLNETVDFSPNRMTPFGRLGQPSEVADAVLFLASDEASYVSGHTLAVTGGR
uniref:SDR-family protein (FabG) n=1 Tax=uncultured marine group II/III euryarchaeote KM3_170_G02 TaxID=1457927 RepID=A0A075GLW2_9EURY|nr:SDR-family protein (fabG) [uncultured marine group II/III euryarchaeote KM3_170_G02]